MIKILFIAQFHSQLFLYQSTFLSSIILFSNIIVRYALNNKFITIFIFQTQKRYCPIPSTAFSLHSLIEFISHTPNRLDIGRSFGIIPQFLPKLFYLTGHCIIHIDRALVSPNRHIDLLLCVHPARMFRQK